MALKQPISLPNAAFQSVHNGEYDICMTMDIPGPYSPVGRLSVS